MFCVDVPRVRGKMAEKGYTLTSVSQKLNVNRNTLAAYFKTPEKMPYGVVSGLADILCDSPEESRDIFFRANLREK